MFAWIFVVIVDVLFFKHFDKHLMLFIYTFEKRDIFPFGILLKIKDKYGFWTENSLADFAIYLHTYWFLVHIQNCIPTITNFKFLVKQIPIQLKHVRRMASTWNRREQEKKKSHRRIFYKARHFHACISSCVACEFQSRGFHRELSLQSIASTCIFFIWWISDSIDTLFYVWRFKMIKEKRPNRDINFNYIVYWSTRQHADADEADWVCKKSTCSFY